MIESVAEPRVQAWERRTEWPLTIVALLFLGAFAWPILQPDIPHGWRLACRAVDALSWLVFVVDYVVRVLLAQRRGRYVAHHPLDLAVVALPIFRPLRLLRLLLMLRVLNRQAADSFRGRVVAYATGSAVIVTLCAALAVLDAERGHPGADINTFGNALWWAITTVTTVGYGDLVPVTDDGRVVASRLMIGGVALIGVVTATFASWLIDRVRDAPKAATADPEPDLASLQAEIGELRSEIRSLRDALVTRP